MESTEPADLANLFAPARPGPVASPAAALLGGVAVVGRLRGFDLDESPIVGDLACSPGRVTPARTTVPLQASMRGREVVVLFEGGDTDRPVIIGVIEPRHPARPPVVLQPSVDADGERCVIEAEREIVLRCGEASITLTRAGKVLISGTYVVSRSKGPHKIKGGTIELN